MPDYNGSYKQVSSENLDNFLKEMGMNMLLRKAAASASPTMIVTVSGDHWKIVTSTAIRSKEFEFDLGKPQEVKNDDGTTATTVVTKEGDKLVEKRSGKGREAEIVREFTDTQLKITMTLNGVTAVRVFNKQ